MSNDILSKEWKQFKSGTDIRGVAMSEPGGEAVTLTDGAVYRMAMGVCLLAEPPVDKGELYCCGGA